MSYEQELTKNAQKMVVKGKGILAADESNPTCTKRFEALGISSCPETRNEYRDVLLTSSGIEKYISGVIMFDETFRQNTTCNDKIPFTEHLKKMNILPGIKVDKGVKDLAGFTDEVVTEGDQETTGNYLTNQGFQKGNTNGWNTSGSVNVCATCGPFGGKALQTGPETAGGTVSQTVDLFDKMNKQEINEGFTINYGSHVFSHQSNATVPVCGSNPANGPDCRDRFSITLDIKDSSGALLHKFEHEFEEITWTGWNTTDFFFNSTVPENTHTSALATLELFGIDAGFTTGHFGPAFDNATITATHTNMIVEQITTITEELALPIRLKSFSYLSKLMAILSAINFKISW